jgi:GDPmannose 4,6-dehydratase
MENRALITGITGQDGAYLSQLLLQKGYKVYGALRSTSSSDHWRLRELNIEKDIELVPLELAEESNIIRVVDRLQVDEIYNLGAQSYVAVTFEQPIYTAEVDGVAACRILEAIRLCSQQAKFYQASTSEMFGKVRESPQTETTPFYPRSPYGVAKLYAYWITVNYRESYGLFSCSGILFNHESPLRGPEFVTRKCTIGLAEIRHGQREVLKLGNLNARRDWGFAGDYVAGIWAMLQAPRPDDYVLATGKAWTIRDFVTKAGAFLDFDIQWEGQGESEVGIDRKSGKKIIEIDQKFYRPAEVDALLGNPEKALRQLGWRPRITFDELVEMMVRADNDRVARRLIPLSQVHQHIGVAGEI